MNWRICMVAVIAFTGCSKATEEPPADPPATRTPAPAAARPAPQSVLVGMVREHGTNVCTPDGDDTWINRHWLVGLVPITAPPDVAAQLTSAKGSAVVAHGRATDQGAPAQQTPPADAVPCPPAQMRSDWLQSIDGIIVQRGTPPMKGFAATRIAPLTGLSAAVEGDEVRVSFANELGIALPEPLEVTVHYEGCYGKPGTTSRTQPLTDGAARFPTMADSQRTRGNEPGTARHRADSVQISLQATGVVFDLDVPLARLGAAVKCPDQ